MRFPTSVGHRLFLLVACQTTVAILLVVMALKTFGGAASDYRHMYGFQVMPIIAIGAAIQEAATLQPGARSSKLDAFYDLYRRQWETVSGNTPDAIRFRKDLLHMGQTVLPQMEASVLADLSKALQKGDVQNVQENLSALQDINIRYASVENQSAMERLAAGRSWLLGIGIGGTLLIWLLGLHVLFAIGPRIRSMVSHVRRFQESGTHEKIGDMGKDDIAVLANALDVGFTAITSRDRDREQFLAVAAHELKTPVTTIQGYASFLVTHPQEASYTSRALEIINRQSRRLSRLIEALFLAVRARSGDLRFDPKPLNLSVLVQRVLQEMEPFLAKNALESHVTEDISVLGDESLLEHALWCLVTCTVALSPAKAPIQLALTRRQSATLTINVQESDIPMQEVLNLFLPLRSLQYETDGLRSPVGLYLSREIVRMHNGQLYVHPVSEFESGILDGVTDMTTKARNSVLVIDDDPYLRELIETLGLSCGVPVIQAADCRSGLAVLERESRKIKMVLLDYFMPGMQPVQCAAEIMAKAGPAIPVILLTAAVDPAARAAELKISRWVAKPFDPSTLTDLLTESEAVFGKSRR